MSQSLTIGGERIEPGEARRMEIRVARLFTGEWLNLPVRVYHGARPGPRVFLNAAIHGDELNGMEIIRRVLEPIDARRLTGTLIAVPVVNVFGFVQGGRYLPDRRDLNRCFPGSIHGSLASRLAEIFMREVVLQCAYGIDLHTGSDHRSNLPQVRAHLADPETRRLAEAFAAPMMYDAPPIGGSLRAAARRRGIHLLVFEGGEPLRFDEEVIQRGVEGVSRVLGALGMWKCDVPAPLSTFEAVRRKWIRAPRSGIFYRSVELGQEVERREQLGHLLDLSTGRQSPLRSSLEGMVIGFSNNPLTHSGDALVHVAQSRGDHDRE